MNLNTKNGDLSPDNNSDIDEDMHDDEKHNLLTGDVKADGNGSSDNAPNGQDKSSSIKDPSRPRRKKARRACHACQRAHLTCGDERPCARCVKRGLADQCQDGVRKKAKYLHDTPSEALIPPNLGGAYSLGGKVGGVSLPQATISTPPAFYNSAGSPGIDMYPQTPNALQINHGMGSGSGSFNGNPISPMFNSRPTPIPASQAHLAQGSPAGAYPFDPSDPALFNLDIGSFNFVNQYGALEFGMLGHMTSNTGEAEAMTPINQMPNPYNSFPPPENSNNTSVLFPRDAMMNMDYSARQQNAGSVPPLQTPHNTPVIQSVDRNDLPSQGPAAYAIAARPNSLASASPDPVDHSTPEESASSPALFATESAFTGRVNSHQPVQPPPNLMADSNHQTKKKPVSTEEIYAKVKKPWSYTENFHRLFTYLKKNYAVDNMAKISQSLAAVRPALLTFAQRLTELDLVFMEVCVQRTLHEFNDFINSTGTPTLVARRDGSLLAVSEEFCLITGWPKRVLLGQAPNRMVTRGTGSNPMGLNIPGAQDPKNFGSQATTSTIMAPFIAEVMDQESVVQFFEDYSKLAFANPMGRSMRRGKLLKYRTPEDVMRAQTKNGSSRNASRRNSRAPEDVKPLLEQEEGIATESALKKLGEADGMVDCMYSWWIKRDTFEVPLLMIMNFLPILPTDYSLQS